MVVPPTSGVEVKELTAGAQSALQVLSGWRGAAGANPVARKKWSRSSSLERFTITVTAAAASVSVTGPGLTKHEPGGKVDSVIRFEGTLNKPVLKRTTALAYVFCGVDNIPNPGSAIGATTAWQLVLRLPREQFADLLTLVAARRLATVDVLLEGLSRGSGAIRSAGFYTEPVPSEREDEEAPPH
jgi:hypothetical protein